MTTFTKILILIGFIATSVNCAEICSDAPDCLPESCVYTSFILTPYKATFHKARGLCVALGGDIVQEVIGADGAQHHSTMKAIAQSAYDNGYGSIWVGITDAYTDAEGQWKYWSSAKDYKDTDAAWVTTDLDGVAGESQEDCGAVGGISYIYDENCEASLYALCELRYTVC